MTVALRCYHCAEWVYSPRKGLAQCPCKSLTMFSSQKVKGLYSESWNEKTEKHIVYDEPRGVE